MKKPVVTTGTFDGVHFGHRKILQNLIEHARKIDGQSVLFTFEPHPRMVLHPEDHGLELLSSPEEKIRLLEEIGLDHLIIHPFTPEFSRYSAVEYVRDFLVSQIHVHTLIVGYDHHFGRNREGNFDLLVELSELYDFSVKEIPAQEIADCQVSSTKIRKALAKGQVKLANTYLGYNYRITGRVVEGNKLGREFGFPTANIIPEYSSKLIPGNGVYAVRAVQQGVSMPAMMNIGTKPTVTDGTTRNIEVHILDWKGDIYGKPLTVEFVERIRNEEKFETTQQLIDRLKVDKAEAIRILA